MQPLRPFDYPPGPVGRVHAPAGYSDYKSYKPWLRDEFSFRCVYCLTREQWDENPTGHANFGVDHVRPQAVTPEAALSYDNLVYACNYCNASRRAEPLPFDPSRVPLALHLRVDDNGSYQSLTPEGGVLIELLRLNHPGRIRKRILRLRLAAVLEKHTDNLEVRSLYRPAFGYPADLPDLAALRPPLGNAHPGSESRSHHARRARGELAEVY